MPYKQENLIMVSYSAAMKDRGIQLSLGFHEEGVLFSTVQYEIATSCFFCTLLANLSY